MKVGNQNNIQNVKKDNHEQTANEQDKLKQMNDLWGQSLEDPDLSQACFFVGMVKSDEMFDNHE